MCASSIRPRERQRGFTLLEVLVAFTIMAVALAALMQAFGSGLRSSEAAQDRTLLLARAENRLAEVGTAIPLQPGRYEGEADGYAWTVDVHPYGAAEGEARPPRPEIALYAVEVTVSAPDGARQTLSTLRLGGAPEP